MTGHLLQIGAVALLAAIAIAILIYESGLGDWGVLGGEDGDRP